MNVLLLSRYDRSGASSRLRTLQYLPFLQQKGFRIKVSPFFPGGYVRKLYEGRNTLGCILRGFMHRFGAVCTSKQYDLIWVEKEIFPWLPFACERILFFGNVPVVVDYDDAVFHRYDQNKSRLVRSLLGKKIDNIMRRATLVICGNDYLAERASAAGARSIEMIPTAVNLDVYRTSHPTGEERITIGWIGTPLSAANLDCVLEPLRKIAGTYTIRFVIIGGCQKRRIFNGVPVEYWPWSEETEAHDIGEIDIGIMPLKDDSISRGKCGYKLIQYMACGKPVVASPIGANKTIVADGVNGYLAGDQSEWFEKLALLCNSPGLREKMGCEGRRIVEQRYCTRVTSRQLYSVLTSAIQSRYGHGG